MLGPALCRAPRSRPGSCRPCASWVRARRDGGVERPLTEPGAPAPVADPAGLASSFVPPSPSQGDLVPAAARTATNAPAARRARPLRRGGEVDTALVGADAGSGPSTRTARGRAMTGGGSAPLVPCAALPAQPPVCSGTPVAGKSGPGCSAEPERGVSARAAPCPSRPGSVPTGSHGPNPGGTAGRLRSVSGLGVRAAAQRGRRSVRARMSATAAAAARPLGLRPGSGRLSISCRRTGPSAPARRGSGSGSEDDGGEGGAGGGAAEGGGALDRRVQGGAQGPDVGGGAGVLALGPFGRQVVEGADEFAAAGEMGLGTVARVVHGGDAEVGEDDPARGVEQHVAGLHVAVQHARAVRGGQRFEDLRADRRGLARVQDATLAQDVVERGAVDQFHDDDRDGPRARRRRGRRPLRDGAPGPRRAPRAASAAAGRPVRAPRRRCRRAVP